MTEFAEAEAAFLEAMATQLKQRAKVVSELGPSIQSPSGPSITPVVSTTGYEIEDQLLLLEWKATVDNPHKLFVKTLDVPSAIGNYFVSNKKTKVKLRDGSTVYWTRYGSLLRYTPESTSGPDSHPKNNSKEAR